MTEPITRKIRDRLKSRWVARGLLKYRRLHRTATTRTVHTPIGDFVQDRVPGQTVAVASHMLVLVLGFLLVAPFLGSGHVKPEPVIATARTITAVQWGSPARSAAVAQEIRESGSLPDSSPAPSAPVNPTTAAAPVMAAPRAAAPVQRPAAPTSAPPPASAGSGVAAIYAVFGNSPGLSWALRVAKCESGYNPLAVNRYSGASGLFQFMPSTWNANFPGWNIWDPYAQARAALRFYNEGRTSAWVCR